MLSFERTPMDAPSLKTTHNVVERNTTNSGWIVKGAFPKEFLDRSSNYYNAYVEAFSYANQLASQGKRKYSTTRNYTIIDQKDRLGNVQKFIRITRPKGGYKFFLVPAKGTPSNPYLLDDIEATMQKAASWFINEREKCEHDITLKNAKIRQDRKSRRITSLTGGYISQD